MTEDPPHQPVMTPSAQRKIDPRFVSNTEPEAARMTIGALWDLTSTYARSASSGWTPRPARCPAAASAPATGSGSAAPGASSRASTWRPRSSATTGWRFVVEKLEAVGHFARLAEPAETAAKRGCRQPPKTGRTGTRHMRKLLQQGRLPQSWFPLQRIQAQFYYHSIPHRRRLVTAARPPWLEALAPPDAARVQIAVALSLIGRLSVQLRDRKSVV